MDPFMPEQWQGCEASFGIRDPARASEQRVFGTAQRHQELLPLPRIATGTANSKQGFVENARRGGYRLGRKCISCEGVEVPKP
jgi:hypothetical protein